MKPRRAAAVVADRGAGGDRRPRYGARMLTRGLSILDRFAERDEWPFMALCQAVGLHKSTAFRLVSALEAAGYVERRAATGCYRAGPKLRRLEHVLLRAEPVRWAALPPLQDLARQTEETAHLGILYEGDCVTVQIVEGMHAVRMHSTVGRRAPAHGSAMGKALLAHLGNAELDEFVDRFGLCMLTARTITDPERLRHQLGEARRRGWAVDDGELEPGLRCVAVPVAPPGGRPFAAVSVSGPASRLTAARDEQIAHVLQQTARKIVGLLSPGRPFANPPDPAPPGQR
ncbi:MAG: IclR family transcriptional regulator [Candidatus Rokubacteria bacterium]|nr:IclR family transcriptional regulator [Candidatus Rokubacteria bacterium]